VGQPIEYASLPGWSQSRLKVLLSQTPAHLRKLLDSDTDRTPSEAMLRGQLVEDLVQRPATARDHWTAAPEGIDRRTKEGKQIWAEFQEAAAGKQIVSNEIYAMAEIMAHNVLATPAALQLIAGADAQRTLAWTDPETGLACKGLCDWLREDFDGATICDLKTVQPGDGSPSGFARWLARWNGDVQAAYYCDGAAAVLGVPVESVRWAWIVAEADEIAAVSVYTASPRMIASGRAKYRRCLEIVRDCEASGAWTGYSVEPVELDPVRWSDWSGDAD